MSLQFDLPAHLSAEKLIAELSKHVSIQQDARYYAIKTYYDSFDWRLYNNAIICEFNRSKSASTLQLKNLDHANLIAIADLKEVPDFSHQFQNDTLRTILAPLLEMRALTPIVTLDYTVYPLSIINEDGKTVLRLSVEAHELLANRVSLQPVKGYEKDLAHCLSLFQQLDVEPTHKPLLLAALKLQGRKPNDYSSKITINLAADMRADIAAKYIYSHLLKAIKDNEQGTIANTDSEFLHDFRVAVRRTRAGLSQLKGVLPEETNAYFAAFFSWLGQITGPTRDLDVYLLSFADYKTSLPATMQDDLDPLYEFLLAKQQKAQQELAKKLRTPPYLSKMSEWESFLKAQAPFNPIEYPAKLTIKQVADRRLWKNYKRVLKEGNAITDASPHEALHELRKSCKKLRYLMEFFQSLYPEKAIRHFIKNLKGLQEVLGAFQDCSVQEQTLKQFSEEMLSHHVHANTLLAMGVLIQNLDTHRNQVREEFADRFNTFKHEENHTAFKELLAVQD